MALTNHAQSRIAERLDGKDTATISDALAQFCDDNPRGDIAVRVCRIAVAVGRAWTDTSNGDVLWAIVRNGTVPTVFWRRHTQTATLDTFRTQRIIALDIRL